MLGPCIIRREIKKDYSIHTHTLSLSLSLYVLYIYYACMTSYTPEAPKSFLTLSSGSESRSMRSKSKSVDMI